MKQNQVHVKKLLQWLSGKNVAYKYSGDSEACVEGFSSLGKYKPNTITWIKNASNYISFLGEGGEIESITCAVVEKGLETNIQNAIVVDNSKDVFFSILREFWGEKRKEVSIGEGTVVTENVKIEDGVSIGCNCSIVGDVVIGEGTTIEHNVVIQGKVRIGKRCYIQSESVIGISGFGYSLDSVTNKKVMIQHFGGVMIGNDVFIGSHVNIARGTIDDTVIGNDVKIAPSTHIGHNSCIGEDTTIICSVLYGSVKIGKESYVTATIVGNQKEIGGNTVVGMGSVVTKSIESGVVAYGIPAVVRRKNDCEL
ncbi:hypothetical protein [Butyrivibrio fibrisolvens]|uniref:hypothetical protein n=1 Tax=Butyrivibrio fibrisolvens TaxID=831 RepID=UPI0003FA530F|nr:hypothetical protein [Butyrivibrio fibrisolvens]